MKALGQNARNPPVRPNSCVPHTDSRPVRRLFCTAEVLEGTMRTPQLLRLTVIAGAVAVAAACNRADTTADARRAAAEVKKAAAKAGDQLADSWLTTQIQAQYFSDDDIKGRSITASPTACRSS